MVSNSNISSPATKQKKRKIWIAGLAIFVLIAIFRIYLPDIVLRYINRKLHSLSEYTGNVREIDIRLIRGAYIIKDIVIDKIDKKNNDTIHFFATPKIDLSLDWRSLLKGSVVGKILVKEPVINYTNEINKDKDISQDTADFRELLKSLMPLTVNRFEIHNGQIHYIDPKTNPLVDIALTNIYVVAANLTNVINRNELLPANARAMASMYGGRFTLNIKLNPLKKNPTFELQTEMKEMDMKALNPFFKAYGNFEVNQGKFSLYAEFAGKEGNFGGYVKPFITDFEIKKWKENDALTQRIWEMLVGTVMKILQNPKSDQVATKIPVKGQFSDPEINIWKAIHYIVRNAFVQALRPSIEHSISVYKLTDDSKKTFLEKIFSSKDKKEKHGKN